MTDFSQLNSRQKALLFSKISTNQRIWNKLAKEPFNFREVKNTLDEVFDEYSMDLQQIEEVISDSSFNDLYSFFEKHYDSKKMWESVFIHDKSNVVKTAKKINKATPISNQALREINITGIIGNTKGSFDKDSDKAEIFISRYFALKCFETVLTKDLRYKGKASKAPTEILEQLQAMLNSLDVESAVYNLNVAIEQFRKNFNNEYHFGRL